MSGLRGAISGYVADAPARARDLIEPLMAAYDFDAAERDGVLCFFHRGAADPVLIPTTDYSAASAATDFLVRADPAAFPREARIRFLDAARDYQIAAATVRRLEGARGVQSIDAPLVLEPEAAEALAQRVLDDSRARFETAAIEVSAPYLALEPGDMVALADHNDVFEIAAIEDAEVRRLELRRARPACESALAYAETGFTPPPLAPAPLIEVLDLPPLPGSEDDERPLAAILASPWLGPHAVFGGVELSPRAMAEQPAVVGELVWDLWPGPTDRWDEGNFTRIKLYDGALTSVSRSEVLNGANAFAIESDGEWEILQAARCTLVAPDEYELADLLRGRLGSEHAMRAPHPAGARIVRLDNRLARLEVAGHEWGEGLTLVAPPADGVAGDQRSSSVTIALPRAAARAWAPAHVRARRMADGGVRITWVRRARSGGDAWGAGEPPLDGPEAYQLEILSGDVVRRTMTVGVAEYLYSSAEQASDFGGAPSSFRLRVAQLDRFGRPGLKRELTITL